MSLDIQRQKRLIKRGVEAREVLASDIPEYAGAIIAYAVGARDLPLLTSVMPVGERDLQLLTSVMPVGERELQLLTSALAVGVAEYDAAILLFNLHLKATISVDFRFKKWNDITNALISTTTVTVGALDVGLKTTRDHFNGSAVTRDTLKVGTDATAVDFATQTDVITAHTTWSAVTKSKPASNRVDFDPGEPPATRARPTEPAAGGTNTLRIREGSITSFARGLTDITLTWTKDSGGADTVKESLFLECCTSPILPLDEVKVRSLGLLLGFCTQYSSST